MHDVAMRRCTLVRAMEQLVRMPDHLGQIRRQPTELDRLALGGQMHPPMDQRPQQSQIESPPCPASSAISAEIRASCAF